MTDSRETDIDPDALEGLFARAARNTSIDPLCAVQVAVGHRGRLVGSRTFGRARFAGVEREASADSLFSLFSVTKAIVASAAWLLLQEGKLALTHRVVDFVPEFARHGKQQVTVEQLLTHTAGFPDVTLAPLEWNDPVKRVERFADWTLDWQPGSRFVYHHGATKWLLAELITRVSGQDYRDFVRTRIFEPLGLEDLHIGLPEPQQARVADVIACGDGPGDERRGASPVDAPAVDEAMIRAANSPELRAVGTPGGGGIGTAGDVALFYQALLGDASGSGPGIWDPETLADAWTPRNSAFVDAMTGHPALRGLGVVVAGDEGRMWRGFAPNCSPRAFGHMGAGGQVSWADPQTGLSFVHLTNAAQRDAARQGAVGFRLSSLAAACAGPD